MLGKKTLLLKIFFLFLSNNLFFNTVAQTISLNGLWETGNDRNYTRSVIVPSISENPKEMNSGSLWFRKIVTLPEGQWQFATLILRGARFCPKIYVNNILVSEHDGGMALTVHFLNHKDITPGKTVTLEIELQSLKNVLVTDASYIPVADQWRSNISSCIWDDVVLQLHRDFRIEKIIPFTDFKKKNVSVHYALQKIGELPLPIFGKVELVDKTNQIIFKKETIIDSLKGVINFSLDKNIKTWSPENPNLYKLRFSVFTLQSLIDSKEISFGLKDFHVEEKQFLLNNKKYKLRAGTVVWHRWVRDDEGRELAYDTTWFKNNVINRLKKHGANAIRFHLGNPPERFLDLCDKYGLLVQCEWSFFHGLPASEESLTNQWRNWFDLAMLHPSIAIIHPYNETATKQLKTAWAVLDKLTFDYPPIVLEDRDVIHIHKYWWSLFENLGLYYDSYKQFDKAIMVDEFGGNYLDGNYNAGGYPTTKAAFLRFLGRNNNAEQRIHHQNISNSKVAEYWRRIGAAGFSPFTILASYEDGNHWFAGKLKAGNPKPVWDALTAAWSPISLSIEMWDRNFLPDQKIILPVYFFNDTDKNKILEAKVAIVDKEKNVIEEISVSIPVAATSYKIKKINMKTPSFTGEYFFRAQLTNPSKEIKYPVISESEFRTLRAIIPEKIKNKIVGVFEDEKELCDLLISRGIKITDANNPKAEIIITSTTTWNKITARDNPTIQTIEKFVKQGKHVLLLDIGPKFLGPSYPSDTTKINFLQGAPKVSGTVLHTVDFLLGTKLVFENMSEPESHIHASSFGYRLWDNLKPNYTWLWNGLRGGIIVPAVKMEIHGIQKNTFLNYWEMRGADTTKIILGNYYAYELEGYCSFSSLSKDKAVQDSLRKKVKFIVEDAPSLASSMDPNSEIKIIDLHSELLECGKSQAVKYIPLVNCGIGLSKAPVVLINFGNDKGKVILSQLLTSGRLANNVKNSNLYAIRHDEVAVQMVLNMLRFLVEE